ncbi:MAG: DUF305 domain-containing protein [Micavibrio sp.]|nr:DUF305 domain-containing protein [Micavibrio sp.]
MKTIKIPMFICALALLGVTAVPNAYAHDKTMDMKKCMSMSNTGNADVDFIRSMIPHHQMALEMAETELKNGKDAAAKDMAQKVIDAQKREITTMKEWLKEHQ